VEAFGGFDPVVGDRLAGIDAGLMLEHLGWVTVMEPGARVLASRRSVPRAGAFRQAVEAERLFWRWAPILGRGRSVTAHGLLMIGEGARGALNLSFVPRAAGRFTGACLALAASSHRRRLEQLRKELNVNTARSLRAA
jgi:hypothetical protein